MSLDPVCDELERRTRAVIEADIITDVEFVAQTQGLLVFEIDRAAAHTERCSHLISIRIRGENEGERMAGAATAALWTSRLHRLLDLAAEWARWRARCAERRRREESETCLITEAAVEARWAAMEQERAPKRLTEAA